VPPELDKTSPLPQDVPVAIPGTPQCRCLQTQFSQARGDTSAPFSESLWLVGPTKVYSDLGADIGMESIAPIGVLSAIGVTPAMRGFRQTSENNWRKRVGVEPTGDIVDATHRF
jgi:hypothetical protein